MLKKLWNDESGIVTLEYLILATIVGLGLIVGVTGVRNALDSELLELSNAITSLNQTYSYNGVSSCSASVSGAATSDTPFTTGLGHVAPATTVIDVSGCP